MNENVGGQKKNKYTKINYTKQRNVESRAYHNAEGPRRPGQAGRPRRTLVPHPTHDPCNPRRTTRALQTSNDSLDYIIICTHVIALDTFL